MSLFVKICGMTDAAAVRAAVEHGADAIGFVFAESVRRVSPAAAVDLSADVPARVRRVAVMLHPTAAEWREVEDVFRPDVLQTDAADFASLDVSDDIERWPVYREGAGLPETLPPTFVYEGPKSGQGQTVDWSRASDIASRGRMILAGGLGPDNVADAVRRVAPFGVDVSSAVESAPGKKDPAKISAFITAARAPRA